MAPAWMVVVATATNVRSPTCPAGRSLREGPATPGAAQGVERRTPSAAGRFVTNRRTFARGRSAACRSEHASGAAGKTSPAVRALPGAGRASYARLGQCATGVVLLGSPAVLERPAVRA